MSSLRALFKNIKNENEKYFVHDNVIHPQKNAQYTYYKILITEF